MDLLSNLAAGFGYLAGLEPAAALVIGVVLGILVGAMPGLSPAMGIALLVPFTYKLSPQVSLFEHLT